MDLVSRAFPNLPSLSDVEFLVRSPITFSPLVVFGAASTKVYLMDFSELIHTMVSSIVSLVKEYGGTAWGSERSLPFASRTDHCIPAEAWT